MNKIEKAVVQHYGGGSLLSRIMEGLVASGADLNNLQPDDLSSIDEFHIGGRKATVQAIEKMALQNHHHVLDVGCGIGGTARYIASQKNCTVSAIDLTPEYIEIAKTLTELTRLKDKINFDVASALNMPFSDETFDVAMTLHVAMNISKREELYKEIARVLKPGATLYIFDVMKKNDVDLHFPVPWANTEKASHLTTPSEMYPLLENAGFEIKEANDLTDFARNFIREGLTSSNHTANPLGTHILMGETAAEKIRNVTLNIENGSIIPVQMLATLTASH